MLKNPISIWDSVDIHEQHRLFFFLFEARLSYSKIDAFRTANELSTTRLFEEFSDENSADVDLIIDQWNQIIQELAEWNKLKIAYESQFATV